MSTHIAAPVRISSLHVADLSWYVYTILGFFKHPLVGIWAVRLLALVMGPL